VAFGASYTYDESHYQFRQTDGRTETRYLYWRAA